MKNERKIYKRCEMNNDLGEFKIIEKERSKMGIIFNRLFSKAITVRTANEIEKRPTLFKMLADTPEAFKLEAWVENDEINIKIKRKDDIYD